MLTLLLSLPLSFVYAWSAMEGHPWGEVLHSLLYALSVVPLGVAYMLGVCLWQRPFSPLKSAGRMALLCYIGQSLVGIFMFYGVGMGWGTSVGLVYICMIAVAVFFAEVVVCHLWLRQFRFGPLEWIWRMLTYGQRMKLSKQ